MDRCVLPRTLVEVRVLVVDDSFAVRVRVCAMLREYPFVAVVWDADSARDALTIARENQPDIVVLDVHMPDASGHTIIPQLVALDARPAIIVMTNDPTRAHQRESLALGAHHFLDKSRNFGELGAIIEAIAAVRRRGA